MADLTHVDEHGKARMVDVSSKDATRRDASARAVLRMRPETLFAIGENRLAKGDAYGGVRIAGIMAAKRTSDIIPLCHSIQLSKVDVDVDLQPLPLANEPDRTDGR